MIIDAEHWAPRRCFMVPIPELETVADLLSCAADCLLAGLEDAAREKIAAANLPIVHSYARTIMGKSDPEIHCRRHVPGRPDATQRAPDRMPGGSQKRELYTRDGWRCRYCCCRVVPLDIRDHLRKLLPGAITIGPSADDCHAAFLALSAVPDHVVPHCLGGGNDLGNLVTACWPCNNGRGSCTLGEQGLIDPRAYQPSNQDGWDGLTRIMSIPVSSKLKSFQAPMTTNSAAATARGRPFLSNFKGYPVEAPTPPKAPRLDEETFFRILKVADPEHRDMLRDFLISVKELGISAEYQRSLVLRFSAASGESVSAGFIMKNGTVEVSDGYRYANELGRNAIGEAFLASIAATAGGVVRTQGSGLRSVVRRTGKMIRLEDLLDDADRWKAAIAQLVAGLTAK